MYNLELLTEEGKFNYAAYLLADMNGTSIKVAKYNEKDRYELIENNKYGYCSLIKAAKRVLTRIPKKYDRSIYTVTPNFIKAAFSFLKISQNGGLNGRLNGGLKSLLEVIKNNPGIMTKEASELYCTIKGGEINDG